MIWWLVVNTSFHHPVVPPVKVGSSAPSHEQCSYVGLWSDVICLVSWLIITHQQFQNVRALLVNRKPVGVGSNTLHLLGLGTGVKGRVLMEFKGRGWVLV